QDEAYNRVHAGCLAASTRLGDSTLAVVSLLHRGATAAPSDDFRAVVMHLRMLAEKDLDSIDFFWPQVVHAFYLLVPTTTVEGVFKAELLEDFILAMALRSTHLALKLVWCDLTGESSATPGRGGAGKQVQLVRLAVEVEDIVLARADQASLSAVKCLKGRRGGGGGGRRGSGSDGGGGGGGRAVFRAVGRAPLAEPLAEPLAGQSVEPSVKPLAEPLVEPPVEPGVGQELELAIPPGTPSGGGGSGGEGGGETNQVPLNDGGVSVANLGGTPENIPGERKPGEGEEGAGVGGAGGAVGGRGGDGERVGGSGGEEGDARGTSPCHFERRLLNTLLRPTSAQFSLVGDELSLLRTLRAAAADELGLDYEAKTLLTGWARGGGHGEEEEEEERE
ncbi:unnamed protein product, partial [Laminaria digitata]